MNVLQLDEKKWSENDRRTIELFGARARAELKDAESRPSGGRGRRHTRIVVDERSDDDVAVISAVKSGSDSGRAMSKDRKPDPGKKPA